MIIEVIRVAADSIKRGPDELAESGDKLIAHCGMVPPNRRAARERSGPAAFRLPARVLKMRAL